MKDNINPTETNNDSRSSMEKVDSIKCPLALQKITPIVEKAAEENGLIALETALVKEAGVWTVRIFLYREGGAITHDDCQLITKEVDKYLDEVINVPYRLEVSSPGLDRKLKSEKEYNIFKGCRVKVKLKNHPERGYEPFLATLGGYNEEDGIILEPLDKEGILTVKKEMVSSIKLEPEF